MNVKCASYACNRKMKRQEPLLIFLRNAAKRWLRKILKSLVSRQSVFTVRNYPSMQRVNNQNVGGIITLREILKLTLSSYSNRRTSTGLLTTQCFLMMSMSMVVPRMSLRSIELPSPAHVRSLTKWLAWIILTITVLLVLLLHKLTARWKWPGPNIWHSLLQKSVSSQRWLRRLMPTSKTTCAARLKPIFSINRENVVQLLKRSTKSQTSPCQFKNQLVINQAQQTTWPHLQRMTLLTHMPRLRFNMIETRLFTQPKMTRVYLDKP